MGLLDDTCQEHIQSFKNANNKKDDALAKKCLERLKSFLVAEPQLLTQVDKNSHTLFVQYLISKDPLDIEIAKTIFFAAEKSGLKIINEMIVDKLPPGLIVNEKYSNSINDWLVHCYELSSEAYQQLTANFHKRVHEIKSQPFWQCQSRILKLKKALNEKPTELATDQHKKQIESAKDALKKVLVAYPDLLTHKTSSGDTLFVQYLFAASGSSVARTIALTFLDAAVEAKMARRLIETLPEKVLQNAGCLSSLRNFIEVECRSLQGTTEGRKLRGILNPKSVEEFRELIAAAVWQTDIEELKKLLGMLKQQYEKMPPDEVVSIFSWDPCKGFHYAFDQPKTRTLLITAFLFSFNEQKLTPEKKANYLAALELLCETLQEFTAIFEKNKDKFKRAQTCSLLEETVASTTTKIGFTAYDVAIFNNQSVAADFLIKKGIKSNKVDYFCGNFVEKLKLYSRWDSLLPAKEKFVIEKTHIGKFREFVKNYYHEDEHYLRYTDDQLKARMEARKDEPGQNMKFYAGRLKHLLGHFPNLKQRVIDSIQNDNSLEASSKQQLMDVLFPSLPYYKYRQQILWAVEYGPIEELKELCVQLKREYATTKLAEVVNIFAADLGTFTPFSDDESPQCLDLFLDAIVRFVPAIESEKGALQSAAIRSRYIQSLEELYQMIVEFEGLFKADKKISALYSKIFPNGSLFQTKVRSDKGVQFNPLEVAIYFNNWMAVGFLLEKGFVSDRLDSICQERIQSLKTAFINHKALQNHKACNAGKKHLQDVLATFPHLLTQVDKNGETLFVHYLANSQEWDIDIARVIFHATAKVKQIDKLLNELPVDVIGNEKKISLINDFINSCDQLVDLEKENAKHILKERQQNPRAVSSIQSNASVTTTTSSTASTTFSHAKIMAGMGAAPSLDESSSSKAAVVMPASNLEVSNNNVAAKPLFVLAAPVPVPQSIVSNKEAANVPNKKEDEEAKLTNEGKWKRWIANIANGGSIEKAEKDLLSAIIAQAPIERKATRDNDEKVIYASFGAIEDDMKIPEYLICPISFELMDKPVRLTSATKANEHIKNCDKSSADTMPENPTYEEDKKAQEKLDLFMKITKIAYDKLVPAAPQEKAGKSEIPPPQLKN